MKSKRGKSKSIKKTAKILIVSALITLGAFIFLLNFSTKQIEQQPYGTLKEEGQLLWMHPNGEGWKTLLKNTPEEWDTTLDSINGFGVFVSDIQNANQEDVNRAVEFLNAHNLRLQIETGGLRDFTCTAEKSAAIDIPILEKLQKANLKQVILRNDAPASNTLQNSFSKFEDNPCQYTEEEFTQEYIRYMKIIQEKYPGVEFYWNEPIGFFDAGPHLSNSGYNVAKLEELIPAVFSEADAQNINLVGFSLDLSVEVTTYYSGEGWERMLYLENIVHDQGKRFSVLLNFAGNPCPTCFNGQTATNEEFYVATLGYYDCYTAKGGYLDDIYPESWWAHPTIVIPEEKKYSFANLMLAFIERKNNPGFEQTCDFIEDTFIPEEWGTRVVSGPYNPTR